MLSDLQLPHYTFIFGVIATLIGLSAAYIQFKKELDEAKEAKIQNQKREEEFKALLLKYEALQESSNDIIQKSNEQLQVQKDINIKQDSAISLALSQLKSNDHLLSEQSKLIELQTSNFRELSGSDMIPYIEYQIFDVLETNFYWLVINLRNDDSLTLRNTQFAISHEEDYVAGSAEWSAAKKMKSYEEYLDEIIPKTMHAIDIPPKSKIRVGSTVIKFTKNLQKMSKISITWKGGTFEAQMSTRIDDFIPNFLINSATVKLHDHTTVKDSRKFIEYSSNITDISNHKVKIRERLLNIQ